MEVVAAAPRNGSPFHNHDVREWSRLDSITGVLERARLETDHWTANTATTSHKYNKVVDSRARSGADGSVQQQARRKLEVFQSQVPGGRIQVIKTQTVSSSKWSSGFDGLVPDVAAAGQFQDLQLAVNPLDLTTEKSKASVGRSVGRRPPSRSRIRDDVNPTATTATANLHRVSRLCHQIHEKAVRRTFAASSLSTPSSERQSGDGVEITEIVTEPETNTHFKLTRTKSTSSEDLQDAKKSLEDLQDLEQLQNWRRTSKLRRSLQYPKQKVSNSKPPDLPVNTGSVRKLKQDLETGKRLNTALRRNNVDLDALDEILKSISNSSVSSDYSDLKYEEPEKDENVTTRKQKRNSFVTVESIQAVRDRLRRTSSPNLDIYKNDEDIDDGIVSDHTKKDMPATPSKVKSYIYGMENINKNSTISGTGSLESRSKQNGTSINRNEDWFSRRKSYGFEQMHNQTETSISSRDKSRVESSTDSGICRSTEIVVVPTATKTSADYKLNEYTSESDDDKKYVGNVRKYTSIFENRTSWNRKHLNRDKDVENGTKITIPIISEKNGEVKRHSIAVDESKYMSKTNNNFKRTSLVFNDKTDEEDDSSQNRKHNKKVEFCKTEVHFAAESGKVNIVETDEKPPPTQNFRRRRRSSGILENFTKPDSDLPVLHFGDTSYEKTLFGDNDKIADEAVYENLENNTTHVNVTVNANGTSLQDYEEQRENIENEAPKGILKNKPIKPKPYILGDYEDKLASSSNSDSERTWGVKLRSTQKTDSPIWRSTVTVQNNTFYDQTEPNSYETQPEFRKLLTQLRPTTAATTTTTATTTTQPDEPIDNKRNSDGFNSIRILSPPVDTRRSSWSVADRIKQVEDLRWNETKGYSTKVNFEEGEATVVEDRNPTWPRREETSKGRNETNPKHTVCSKTTTNSDTNGTTTTTTKITIDLTPSPPADSDSSAFKFPRAAIQSFKSPSLIMSTLKGEGSASPVEVTSRVRIPPQLEVLRKLYEDVHSDSEADREVHQILTKGCDGAHDDGSSVVSGSWSKMRAFKHLNHYQKPVTVNGSHALIEKDNPATSPERENSKSKFHYIDEEIQNNLRYLNEDVENLNISNYASIRKNIITAPLKSAHTNEKLSSPYLVGQKTNDKLSYNSDTKAEDKSKTSIIEKTPVKEVSYSTKPSAAIDKAPVTYNAKTKLTKPVERLASKEHVLRHPKKSELAYFGVNISAKKTEKKVLDKPDLLQFNSVEDNKRRTEAKSLSRVKQPVPIYENIEQTRNKINKFDSSILEELTKAADQILQAVNGYTDEEYHSKLSSDDEKKSKVDILDTISETRSWKQNTSEKSKANSKTVLARTKAKTSSNSSIDSISRECRRNSLTSTDRKMLMTKSAEQKQRKKAVTSDSSKAAATKARRLQRASSREALLQSHGSSSEDLTAQVEVVRKPRTVKKTKTAQLTITNGIELKKPIRKREDVKPKQEERLPVVSLPEIRHKTAVSTIRSTAEKVASRERAKRSEDLKKKSVAKKEYSKGMTSSTTKSERVRSSTSRETSGHRHLPAATTQKKTTRC